MDGHEHDVRHLVHPGRMDRPDDWCDLDDAYLAIFGHHPDLSTEDAAVVELPTRPAEPA